MTRLRLVSAPDAPESQAVLNLAEKAGYRVLFADGVYTVEAGPFASLDELLSHLNRPGFCLECGDPAEQLCGACVTSHVDQPNGAADGTGDKQVGEEEGRSRHPSAAPMRPTLEVVR